ncbi:SURF1 family protein [Dermabacter sp. p3-SID358]|uniref:SURF1 family protein n=1 Tax=Dermabacter sp. p3-SID358 TaxID=2916114 RepID=UPI0021A30BC1|nr:SURF1 family cytochrome oxidase biogenesis protein [Dermabacter sp. p3-SID358]MCT1866810.1 SURF1 family protein [Dermabacter sp. p3-SID358]
MLRVALRPKFLGLLALMATATLVCGLLANWQFERATRALDARDETQSAAPVPIEELMDAHAPVTNAVQGRLASFTGEFVPSEQVLVPGREIDGHEAAVVVTNARITQGPLRGTSIPVARGYTTAPSSEWDSLPEPPTGSHEIVVRLEASEEASGTVRREGDGGVATVGTLSSTLLVNVWEGPMLAGYGALTNEARQYMAGPGESDGASATAADAWRDLGPLPAAQSSFTSGLNLQNFGYMLQWILFGVFFLYIWWRSVRSTYLDEQAERRLELESRLAGESSD